MVRVVRVAHDKGPQGTEVRLDRIGPGRVRRREAQLDVLPLGPAADRRGLVRRQVVQDHEQPVAAGPGGPDRLQRGQGVTGALVLADHAPQLVIAQGIAAVEVADAVGAVVGRAQPGRVFARRPAGPVARADRQRPELVEGEAAVGVMAGHVLDPVQLGVRSGSRDSFQVRVRWKLIPRACRICRSRSRPIGTGRSGSPG